MTNATYFDLVRLHPAGSLSLLNAGGTIKPVHHQRYCLLGFVADSKGLEPNPEQTAFGRPRSISLQFIHQLTWLRNPLRAEGGKEVQRDPKGRLPLLQEKTWLSRLNRNAASAKDFGRQIDRSLSVHFDFAITKGSCKFERGTVPLLGKTSSHKVGNAQ